MFPNQLRSANIIAIDIETRDDSIGADLGPGELRGGYICGVSLATDDGFSEYYPIAHEEGNNLDKEQVFKFLNQVLGHKDQCKLGTRITYDVGYLNQAGVKVEGRLLDVSVAEALIDENQRSYSLNSLAQKYLQKTKDEQDLYDYLATKFGKRTKDGTLCAAQNTRAKQAGNIWRAPGYLVKPYAISDVLLPLEIYKKQRAILQQENLVPLFELESDLLPMLIAMRTRGVRLDLVKLEEVKEIVAFKLKNTEDSFFKSIGKRINYNSSSQVADLFIELNINSCQDLIESIKTVEEALLVELQQGKLTAAQVNKALKDAHSHAGLTASGKIKTDAKTLNKLAKNHPFVAQLKLLRELQKLQGTYLNGYFTEHPISGRIHAQFHSFKSDEGGTVSGRFSSSDPNLQNIPKRHPEFGSLLRSLFLPEEQEDLYADDWSQIEFRMLVHYAQGRTADLAQKAYNENPDTDFHTYTQQLILEKTGKNLSRSHVKNINFGLVYGMGKKTLSENLGLPLNEIEELFTAYHAAMPFIKETSRRVQNRAATRGYIKTLLGRRRRFPLFENAEFGSRSERLPYDEAIKNFPAVKRADLNKTLNGLLQGSAADVNKICMLKIWQSGICDVLGAPLWTIHDELGWSVAHTQEAEEAHNEAVHIMKTCVDLKVPLDVSSKKGANWGELE